MRKLVPSMAIALLCLGAGGACTNVMTQVRNHAAFDLSCPAAEIQVTELSENEYGASGCGRKEKCVDIPFVGLDCKAQ